MKLFRFHADIDKTRREKLNRYLAVKNITQRRFLEDAVDWLPYVKISLGKKLRKK
jgi:hypothetical protein